MYYKYIPYNTCILYLLPLYYKHWAIISFTHTLFPLCGKFISNSRLCHRSLPPLSLSRPLCISGGMYWEINQIAIIPQKARWNINNAALLMLMTLLGEGNVCKMCVHVSQCCRCVKSISDTICVAFVLSRWCGGSRINSNTENRCPNSALYSVSDISFQCYVTQSQSGVCVAYRFVRSWGCETWRGHTAHCSVRTSRPPPRNDANESIILYSSIYTSVCGTSCGMYYDN